MFHRKGFSPKSFLAKSWRFPEQAVEPAQLTPPGGPGRQLPARRRRRSRDDDVLLFLLL